MSTPPHSHDSEPNDSPTSAPDRPPQSRRISRRQFGRAAAMATAASLTVPALLTPAAVNAEPNINQAENADDAAPQQKPSATTPAHPKPPETAAHAKSPEPLKGLTPQQVADVDAKLANILRKHPDRFSPEQKKRLRRILAQQERLLAPVRAFHVENGDPPASVLRVSFKDVILPPTNTGSE